LKKVGFVQVSVQREARSLACAVRRAEGAARISPMMIAEAQTSLRHES
jgi:hypothetical protein